VIFSNPAYDFEHPVFIFVQSPSLKLSLNILKSTIYTNGTIIEIQRFVNKQLTDPFFSGKITLL